MADRRLRVIRRGAGGEADETSILGRLDTTTIAVRLTGADPDSSTQILAEALVDLLSRLFPRIAIDCDPAAPAHPGLGPGEIGLRDRLEAARQHGHPPTAPGEPQLTIGVGPGDLPADLYADGHGWQAYLGTVASKLEHGESDPVPVGPLTAAARVAAHAFTLVMRDVIDAGGVVAAPSESVYWSGLTFETSPDPLPTMESMSGPPAIDAVLVGAGSIGGAATYSFARTDDLGGHLDIVDPQLLDDTNPDRALLATAQASNAGRLKVDVAKEAIAHLPALAVDKYEMTIAAFVAGRDRKQTLPLVLSAVDSRLARREIQDCLPLDLINAACDPINSVVSGHRTGAGPCVMCLFIGSILDGEQALARMIVRQVPILNQRQVGFMMATRVPLDRRFLRAVEQARGMDDGALIDYTGKTLRELWHGELVYGGMRAETASGAVVAVAAPWITALAGFLLASEAVKAGDVALTAYRLGPYASGAQIHYVESPYASPQFAQLTSPPRWTGDECLCNSPRRRRLIIARYGLAEDEYPI